MPHAPHLRPKLLPLLVSAALGGSVLGGWVLGWVGLGWIGVGWAVPGWSASARQATPLRVSPAQARPPQPPALPLRATGAWVVAVPPGTGETSVFGTLTNTSARPVVLRSATAPLAAHAMLMNTVTTGTMTGMEAARTLTVPARGHLVLGDLGAHIMLMGLKRPLKPGETISVTLHSTDGRRLVLSAAVRKP
ncbi:copper chaperone PCu(A)C [Deinococcus koreensis]|uniref:Copper chaperone PCu(A)C n=1 Tax=Deinococcus koreensis TaxID=2054903 RepID=A0A2K3UXH7_9DEIO|nr:copper chaperone PCu(A)C [Deinococcus koreensis]PNY81243.1 hypothetical protein CVO96_07470 [Deinococcus koreensis]